MDEMRAKPDAAGETRLTGENGVSLLAAGKAEEERARRASEEQAKQKVAAEDAQRLMLHRAEAWRLREKEEALAAAKRRSGPSRWASWRGSLPTARRRRRYGSAAMRRGSGRASLLAGTEREGRGPGSKRGAGQAAGPSRWAMLHRGVGVCTGGARGGNKAAEEERGREAAELRRQMDEMRAKAEADAAAGEQACGLEREKEEALAGKAEEERVANARAAGESRIHQLLQMGL